jgi:subtilisin family serine protease
MAKRARTRARVEAAVETVLGPLEPSPATEGGTTGRFIVVFTDEAIGDTKALVSAMQSTANAKDVALASEFAEGAVGAAEVADADAVIFENLGIAVVTADPTTQQSMAEAAADDTSNILAVEPEGFMFALGLSKEYLRGFKDAAQRMYEASEGEVPPETTAPATAEFMEAEAVAAFTWGINAVRANTSRFSGQGVKVAILDTGLDLTHPDFAGRLITHRSFIAGQSVQDGNGHGTHCTGTSCGPLAPGSGTRYGIAHQAQIFIGKVLSNQGSGPDTSILSGISWAVTNGCQVISMSLGSPRPPSVAYEQAGQRALNAGCLIVAAAGNDSRRRSGIIRNVSNPANCGSIMAVAAVDRFVKVADFSNRGSANVGGKVDISGPGVAIYSTTPVSAVGGHKPRYDFFDGTSMATPHVAGCAALWCQATGSKGANLYQKLVGNARATDIPSIDGGTGLVQAPQ